MRRFRIIRRLRWGTRRSRPMFPQNPRSVREFFVHWPGDNPRSWTHLDTAAEERAQLRAWRDFHMDDPSHGWSFLAYSHVVFQSGRVYKGRGMDWVPAGQLGHNTGTVACLCVVGPDDEPSKALKLAVRGLLAHCERRAGHSLDARRHGAVVATTCPGPKLSLFVAELDRRG